MAKIIQFPCAPRPPVRHEKNESARIILFSGIRYERIEDDPVRKPRSGRRRKKA